MLASLSGPLDRLAGRERIPQINLASPAIWLPPIVLAAIGFAIRLYGFNRGLWEDEITVAYYTQIGIKNVISTLAQNGTHPPLYFLVAATDSRLGMDVVPAIRVPSLVAGVATILVVYFLVLRLAGRWPALFAAALTTIAPVAVWYSDEGRMYSLLWFFVLASFLLLVWGHDSPHWRWFAIAHGVVVGVALWTDYSAALALGPQVLLILMLKHRRWFLGSWVAGWLSIIPWFYFLKQQYDQIEAQRFPGTGTDLQSWATVLADLSGLRADYASLGDTLPLAASAVFLGLLLASAVATVFAARAGRVRMAVVAVCLTLGALAVTVAFTLQGTVAVIVPRVMGIISFGIVLLFAGGLGILIGRDSRAARLAGIIAVAAVLLCTGASEANVIQNGTNGTVWDTVADTLQSDAQPGDELIYYPIAAKYAVDPYLAASSPWRTNFNGSWPKDDATADQYFATWTAGKPRVWVIYMAIGGVDMPHHDQSLMAHNLCRVMGDPNGTVGIMEYQAMPTHC